MKIAILGSHPLTVYQAPFEDEDWAIWACSPHNFEKRELPRIDEWFEVHQPAPHKTRSDDYLEYVRALSSRIPVWMRDRKEHPNAKEYPEQAMRAEFGPWHFTSSIAFVLAKAVAAKPKAIGLWGILQASNEEYAYQRQGTQYFLWEAHKRGIEIVLPKAAAGLFEPQKVEF